MPEESDRLTRIEEKLDKLSDAIVALARAEEKLVQLTTLTDVLFTKFSDVDSRLRTLEAKVSSTQAFIDSTSKLFWMMVSGIATAIGGLIVYNFFL